MPTPKRMSIGIASSLAQYQNDIPKHMLAAEHLYKQLRSIFRPILSCDTLFQRIEAHGSASWFGHKLISAAANHDMHSSAQPRATIHFHASQQVTTANIPTNRMSRDLIAFFSKTPPPSPHRYPTCFTGPVVYRPGYRPRRRPFRLTSSASSW